MLRLWRDEGGGPVSKGCEYSQLACRVVWFCRLAATSVNLQSGRRTGRNELAYLREVTSVCVVCGTRSCKPMNRRFREDGRDLGGKNEGAEDFGGGF